MTLITYPYSSDMLAVSSHSDSDGMGSIAASPDARNVPLLLCQERFNEASLPDMLAFLQTNTG